MERKRRRRRIDLLRILALLLCLLLIIYAWLFIFMPKTVPSQVRVLIPNAKTNILVIGTDYDYDEHRRRIAGSRADSLILVQIDPGESRINMLSIPRDTLVDIPGDGRGRINASFAYGGQKLTQKTVEQLLGIHVNNYVVLHPDGIGPLIDSLGGLKIYVEKDMHYRDAAGGLKIDLKKGLQKLDGEKVHEYIRFRHDTMGDITRVERQQTALKALFKKLASPATLFRSPWVIDAVRKAIETDLTAKEVMLIANYARMINPEEISSYTLPGDFSNDKELAGYWIADMSRSADLIRHMKVW